MSAFIKYVPRDSRVPNNLSVGNVPWLTHVGWSTIFTYVGTVGIHPISTVYYYIFLRIHDDHFNELKIWFKYREKNRFNIGRYIYNVILYGYAPVNSCGVDRA